MVSLCSHNLTLGIYAVKNSNFVDLDQRRQRIIGIVGSYYDRLVASKNQRWRLDSNKVDHWLVNKPQKSLFHFKKL